MAACGGRPADDRVDDLVGAAGVGEQLGEHRAERDHAARGAALVRLRALLVAFSVACSGAFCTSTVNGAEHCPRRAVGRRTASGSVVVVSGATVRPGSEPSAPSTSCQPPFGPCASSTSRADGTGAPVLSTTAPCRVTSWPTSIAPSRAADRGGRGQSLEVVRGDCAGLADPPGVHVEGPAVAAEADGEEAGAVAPWVLMKAGIFAAGAVSSSRRWVSMSYLVQVNASRAVSTLLQPPAGTDRRRGRTRPSRRPSPRAPGSRRTTRRSRPRERYRQTRDGGGAIEST